MTPTAPLGVGVFCLSETKSSFLNRRAELERLRSLLRNRKSALLHGRSGIGKTALLEQLVAAKRPQEPHLILAPGEREPGRWLRSVLIALLHQQFPPRLLTALALGETATAADAQRALGRKSAGALRRLLSEILAEGDYALGLDPTSFLSRASYGLLRDLERTTGTPLLFSAHSGYMDDIGYATKLALPREQRLALGPLGAEEMAILFEKEAGGLPRVPANLEAFREHALRYAKGIPGTLLGLVRLAGEARYWAGENLKVHLLTVDFNLPRQGVEAQLR